jgi:hypothetical protein
MSRLRLTLANERATPSECSGRLAAQSAIPRQPYCQRLQTANGGSKDKAMSLLGRKVSLKGLKPD